jgi:hypothetical protein
MTSQKSRPIFVGDTVLQQAEHEVGGGYVSMLGDTFYKIKNFDGMPPFFMSLVSSSNHWMFISSTGGLSAGRVSAEQSLFPYYTDDKLTENHENTGNKTILFVTRAGRTSLWEPLSERYRGSYQVERNIYKNIAGTAVLFEEINHGLGVSYRYAWRTSDKFGLVKTTWLENIGRSPCAFDVVDGIQNILPANVTSQAQNIFSPLLDAYKRAELDPETGLAIFALNSTLTDLAEPSESLLAATAMQLGLEQVDYLLSSQQLDRFRSGLGVVTEKEVRGRRNAYFVRTSFELGPEAERSWHIVADVNQDSVSIVHLANLLRKDRSSMIDALETDIELNTSNLKRIVVSADGMQVSNDGLCTAHHFANVMFNVMRGGAFTHQYSSQKAEFVEFVSVRNRSVLDEHTVFFSALPEKFDVFALYELAEKNGSADLTRLSYAYLPLSFSRRHGDPSRPWNRFEINIKKQDGSLKLGYEGNWRDIFQNWEALAYSYPEYIESMICTFLNATTADGYNPYRITQDGIDWEVPDPGNPWANIGYWNDHQIIYLQKLMEISVKVHPGKLQDFLSRSIFSHANVPYRIKPYADLLENPFNTIEFNWDLEQKIESRVKKSGTDGKLVVDTDGNVLHVTMAEKLLTLLLAKLVNFVPEGGIWMNTQRPEWNDANNALVGKGLSVVTLGYLRRFVVFYRNLLEQSALDSVQIGMDTQNLYLSVFDALKRSMNLLQGSFSDEQRRSLMDALGQAGSVYRWKYYSQGVSGGADLVEIKDLTGFLDLVLKYVEHSLRANKRSDNLYHAYNILHLGNGIASVGRLYEMLEGQVSILSSEMLTGAESLELLQGLRDSSLYRGDQHSYILYPDRELPGFVVKNSMTTEQVQGLALVAELEKTNDRTLIVKDEDGICHFSGHIRNMKDVIRALDALKDKPQYAELVDADSEKVQSLFEEVFRHSEFTGRSGTFFAYEGLGSIYWHMTSKLLLAVQETILRTRNVGLTDKLLEHYVDIRKGLSFNKSPSVYGAFPTDPYSHTPKGQGAKQPGMTGLVKEEILTRQVELGFFIKDGRILFDFALFNRDELLSEPSVISYWDVKGQSQQMVVPAGSVAYSICQVPVVLRNSSEAFIEVHQSSGNIQRIDGYVLDPINSRHVLQRDGAVCHMVVSLCK